MESIELAEIGAFEANLAEAVVLDHDADFLFLRWGAEIGTLCVGDHRGHRLSALPQPSRGQLLRVCARATASPRADYGGGDLGSTWADGRARFLALPTSSCWFAVTPALAALLFAPHPMFTHMLWMEVGAAISVISDQDTLSRIRPD
jgi:hypothetical protein